MTGRIDWLLKLWPFTTMKIRQSWNKILPNPKNALKLPKTFYAYTKDYVVGLNPLKYCAHLFIFPSFIRIGSLRGGATLLVM